MTPVFEMIGGAGGPLLATASAVLAEYLVLAVPVALVHTWFHGASGRIDALYAFIGSICSLAAAYGLSLLYHHEPPFASRDTIVTSAIENAFPSHHTAVVLGAALPLYWRGRRRAGHLVLAAGVLTGIARIHVGEHYAVDVLGSLLAAGIALGVLVLAAPSLDRHVRALAAVGGRVQDRLRP